MWVVQEKSRSGVGLALFTHHLFPDGRTSSWPHLCLRDHPWLRPHLPNQKLLLWMII